MIIIAPLLGFAVVVTVSYLGKCLYLYLFQMNDAEARNAPKKARIEYATGRVVVLAGGAIVFLVICWVVGRMLMEVL